MRFVSAVLSGACLGACLAPAAVQANELKAVYQKALANDMTFQAALHARDAAVEARPQARAALLPQVEAGYQWQKGHAKGDGEQPGIDPVTFEEKQFKFDIDEDTSLKRLDVTLNQTVFDWATFKRYDQAGVQVALAQAQFRSAEQSLILRSAQAYFDVLAASDDLRFTQAEKSALDRELEQAHRRFEVGLSAITDVQEAQARYDLTVAQEIGAEQALANAKQAMIEVVGPAEPAIVPMREEIPLQTPNPPQVDSWVSAAAASNLDLVAAQLRAESADRDIDIQRAGHYPTVGLQAQYGRTDQVQGNQAVDAKGPNVGVQVTLPIFSGGLTQSRVRQAEAVHDQRVSERVGAERSVERQTRDAYLAVMAGAARVKALKQAVVSSTTALDASQTGLEVGTRTAVDVLNAQSALYSAQRDYARARYDYLLAVLRLKAAAGSLDAGDLDEIDSLLVS